ncbi:MAG: 6-phosphofructokinase [Deltaproteobacteria bacterium]|nr:MAG: 6-phosphofructokinase [Deltaproteobacteria bacterium]
MKTIGVLTSGGDAPGMNACLRALVRKGIFEGLSVMGIERGFRGLIEGKAYPMPIGSVANIIQRGGTVLRTARCKEFVNKNGRAKAARFLRNFSIDGLVVIGGDGSFRGAHELYQEHKVPVIGIPGTIDNDIYGTDYTIGYDTAVNVALESIDRIRDTASSHDRLFFVEVMGRDAGFIALEVGVGGGAETILLPETKTDLKEMCDRIKRGIARGKTSSIIVVAEGDDAGNAFEIARKVKGVIGMDFRVCVLGHVQRGGSPTSRDRLLGSTLGAAAVDALLAGETDKMVGIANDKVVLVPLRDTWRKKKKINMDLSRLAEILSK